MNSPQDNPDFESHQDGFSPNFTKNISKKEGGAKLEAAFPYLKKGY
jgi:hypothetical protein